VINSASIYLLSIAQTVPEVVGFRIMTGIAHAFFWPPCESIISKVSGEKSRVRNIATFTAFFVGGFMIGPLIGSLLLEAFDVTFRILFQYAAFVLAAAIVSALVLTQHGTTRLHTRFSFSSIKEMARFPHVIVMLIYCTASFGMILAIYPAFLDDRGITGSGIEILYFAFGISRLATLGAAGKLAKKTSHTLIVATLSIAIGLLISFYAESIELFIVAMLIMGFGFSIFFPLTLEIILSKTRKELSGGMIGAYETTFGIGWAVGPITAGIISQFFGNESPYLVFFVIGLGVTILALVKKKKLEPQRNSNL
jgi:MFS family permease